MSTNIEHEYPYPHPYYEEKTGKVNCQICGKPFSIISPRHLKKHNVTHSEYKLKFPDAPLANEEFAVKSLYGRNKDMFVTNKHDEPDNYTLTDDSIIGEEEIVDKEVITVKVIKTDTKPLDPVASMKKRIFNHLSMYLNNIRQNYFIEEKTLGGMTKFRYVSDFADPVLKINVEFPDAFWHNQDAFVDPLREEKLKSGGWKVIKIKGTAPSLEKIEKCLQI